MSLIVCGICIANAVHISKIWALAISKDESTIISGAADSVVTFWTDCTEEIQIEKENARAELILKYVVRIYEINEPAPYLITLSREQDFQNFVQLRDYRSAIVLALAMNQPGRLLSLFTNVRNQSTAGSADLTIEDATSITGSAAVDEVIAMLRGPELVRLLRHLRDWNTSARTSPVAQSVLHAVLKLRSAEDIMRAFELPSGAGAADDDDDDGADGDGNTDDERRRPRWLRKAAQPVSLKELIDGLLPYTERHLARADKLVQDSYVVDYILGEMDMGMLTLEDGTGMEMEMDVDVAVAVAA